MKYPLQSMISQYYYYMGVIHWRHESGHWSDSHAKFSGKAPAREVISGSSREKSE